MTPNTPQVPYDFSMPGWMIIICIILSFILLIILFIVFFSKIPKEDEQEFYKPRLQGMVWDVEKGQMVEDWRSDSQLADQMDWDKGEPGVRDPKKI